MPERTGRISADLAPERRIIMVADTGFDETFTPDFAHDRLMYPGPDMAYLMSASGGWHMASITVEAWTGPPPEPPPPNPHDPRARWEARDEGTLTLTEGSVYITDMLMETVASDPLDLGAGGTYHIRALATGRDRIRDLETRPQPDEPPRGIERFLVQLWPVRS